MIKEFDNIKYSKHQLYSYKQCLLSVYIFQHEEERKRNRGEELSFYRQRRAHFPLQKIQPPAKMPQAPWPGQLTNDIIAIATDALPHNKGSGDQVIWPMTSFFPTIQVWWLSHLTNDIIMMSYRIFWKSLSVIRSLRTWGSYHITYPLGFTTYLPLRDDSLIYNFLI